MTNWTITDVLEAYEASLRLQVRRMQIEKTREETQDEAQERIDAYCRHAELELQYTAQWTY